MSTISQSETLSDSNISLFICFDFKQYRIRIHKRTLKYLRNPKTIRLLVNPKTKLIGIRAIPCFDKDSIKINTSMLTPDECCEIRCTHLLTKLLKLCPSFESGKTYRLLGYNMIDQDYLFFNMDQAIIINDEVETS